MSEEIKNIRLKYSCDIDWDSMDTDIDGTKSCNSCQKKVYDFTNAKQQEFLSILAKNDNNICGRFKSVQMAPVVNRTFSWQKWASAAMFLLGVNIFNNKAEAQNSKPIITKQQKDPESEVFVGMYMPYDNAPEFPGGIKSFTKFLSKNLHYKKGTTNGKVFASFTIEKNGSLADIKIERGANPINNNEVIRVLKLSPKWKPAKQNNKPISIKYTLPVNFQNR